MCAALLCAGCGAVSAGSSGGRPTVVATTTQLGDFTRAIAGDAVSVHQVLRPNTDPHEYEPRPSDVQAVVGAKLVLESGDGLDAWMGKVVQQSGGHPRVVDVGAQVPVRLPGAEGSRFDPHWWHDPVDARAAVATIRAALIAADPAHRAVYARRAAAYTRDLDALVARLRRCFARVPAEERKLVTDHDAFGYFARRFGIRVVGAAIPSQSTEAQSSAGDVAKLSAQIRREHVRAIFSESSLNPRLVRAIARQTGATADSTLYGDTLGPSGSPGATYLGMEAANADAMVRGFTGGREGCLR